MEISSIEALTNTKLKVDRALDTANKTLHRLLEPIPFESEAVTKATELNSIKDKRVYTEMYESEADARIISDKWMLKPQKARYVLRAFEEDVKDEDVFASTTMTTSVRMLLSQTIDLRSEGNTVFTADVKTAFLNAHMEDCDVVCARPPSEWQPETLDPNKGTVIWKLQESLRSAPRRWQGPSGTDPQEMRLRPELACGHTQRSEYHSYSTWTTCCWLEHTRSPMKSLLN